MAYKDYYGTSTQLSGTNRYARLALRVYDVEYSSDYTTYTIKFKLGAGAKGCTSTTADLLVYYNTIHTEILIDNSKTGTWEYDYDNTIRSITGNLTKATQTISISITGTNITGARDLGTLTVDVSVAAKPLYFVWYKKYDGDTAIDFDLKWYNESVQIRTVDSSDFPTKDGYEFLGWDTDANATTPTYKKNFSYYYLTNESMVLYAIWKKITPYVYVYPNDGINSYIYSQVEYGASYTLPTPSGWGDGRNFLGYSGSSSATSASYSAGQSVIIYNHSSFYCVWGTANDVNITYTDFDDHSKIYATEYTRIYKSLNPPASSTMTKTGYTFDHWASNAYDKTSVFSVAPRYSGSTESAYAVFNPNTIAINFNWNNTNHDTDTRTYTYDEIFGSLPEPGDTITNNGLYFTNWYYNDQVITETTVMNFASTVTLVAQWREADANLKYIDNRNGTETVVKTYGINVDETFPDVSPSAWPGHIFKNWLRQDYGHVDEIVVTGAAFQFDRTQMGDHPTIRITTDWEAYEAQLTVDWNWDVWDETRLPSIVTTSTQTYGELFDISTMTKPERPGYTLQGLSKTKTSATPDIEWDNTKTWEIEIQGPVTLYAVWRLEHTTFANRSGSIDKSSGAIFRRNTTTPEHLELTIPVYTGNLSMTSGVLTSYTARSFLAIGIGVENDTNTAIEYHTGPTYQKTIDLTKTITNIYCIEIPKTTPDSQSFAFELKVLGNTIIGSSDAPNIDASTTDLINHSVENWTTTALPPESPSTYFSYDKHYYIRAYVYTNIYYNGDYVYTLPVETYDNFISQQYMTVDMSVEGREIAIGGAASDNCEDIKYGSAAGIAYSPNTRYYKINEQGQYELHNTVTAETAGSYYIVTHLPSEAHLALYGYIDCGTWE